MITIKKVIIENFQSHENTVLDFADGLNVIVGPSDHGKSAVLRAVKWALYNEPRGMEFIRQGATAAKVTLELSNGYSILRERSKSKNRYTVVNPEGAADIYEGFGNEVPEEVVKAHGIPKILLDTDISASLNIADQLEGPFLLSEPASVRAKAIGRLMGLQVVDRARRDCTVDLRRETQTSDRLKNELEEVDGRLEEYRRLREMEIRLANSEALIRQLGAAMEKHGRLGELRRKISESADEHASLRHFIARLSGLDECENAARRCEVISAGLSGLERLSGMLHRTEEEISRTSGVIGKTGNVEACGQILQRLDDKSSSLRKYGDVSRNWKQLLQEWEYSESAVKRLAALDRCGHMIKRADEAAAKESKLNELYGKLKNCGDALRQAAVVLQESETAQRCENTVRRIDNAYERLDKLMQLKERADILESYRTEGGRFLENNKLEAGRLREEYGALLKKIGKCPVCNSEISGSKLNEILKHYEEVDC